MGTSAAHAVATPHSRCTGSSLQLLQASTQHADGTVQVSRFLNDVKYLTKTSTSCRRSRNHINKSSTASPIRACQGELLDLARGLATSPAADLPAIAHHELVKLATTLLGNSKNVDAEIAGGGGTVHVSSSRSCARSAPEKRRVICISGPTA